MLGLLIDKNLGWKSQFYGNDENQGLLKQLSTRLGMLRRLSRFLPNSRFKQLSSGLFYSKFNFGITVWGNILDLPGSFDEEVRNATMMTTCSRYDTPVESLLSQTKLLSVCQQVAYYSLAQVYNMKIRP